jgi:hypothetical protein
MGYLYSLKRRTWFIAAAVVLSPGVVALMPLVAGPIGGPREIVLVVRGMAYYEEGHDTPNPTIRVAPGERVRLVLRNEAAGMTHDFVARSLKVSIPPIAGLGSRSVEFRAPREAGRHPYVCTPHAKMMFGVLEVTPKS